MPPADAAFPAPRRWGPDALTAEEADLLRVLIEGTANKTAAARLRVSLRTVERRRAAALRKLGAETLVAAARHPLFARAAGTDPDAGADPFGPACRDAAAGVAVVDAGGRFLRANAAFCRLLGRGEGELRGLDLAAVTYPDDRDAARNRAFFAGEFATFCSRKRYVRPEGAAVEVHLMASLVLGPDGRPRALGTVVAADDRGALGR